VLKYLFTAFAFWKFSWF